MGSKIALKNAQDQEFSINHRDNAGAISIDSDKILTKNITSLSTPTSNLDMTFSLTSNTQLTIRVKGSDGAVRSANITLA